MSKKKSDRKKEVEKILEVERWQGYASGKVEGALNVLYALDLEREERLELLKKAVGLCTATAMNFLEPREIKERIYKNTKLSIEDKHTLESLMFNETMKNEKVLDHPKETLELISAFSGYERFIEECLPQVKIWIKNGEDVSMKRVRDWLIAKYDLL